MANSSQKPKVYVTIVEEPTNGVRFRYGTESISIVHGVSSSDTLKTFPKIKLNGYIGRATATVSCFTTTYPYAHHPHKIKGDNLEHGIRKMQFDTKTMTCEFANLGIQCVTKGEIDASLEDRKRALLPVSKECITSKAQDPIDLTGVRLGFFVTLEGPSQEGNEIPVEPVFSRIIYDNKAGGSLRIVKLSESFSPVCGHKEMILLCEKVVKDDIEVRFFETLENGEIRWEAMGIFQPIEVHKQYAIALKTPVYFNQQLKIPVHVNVQLRCPSRNTVSAPRTFLYVPLFSDTEMKMQEGKRSHSSIADKVHNVMYQPREEQLHELNSRKLLFAARKLASISLQSQDKHQFQDQHQGQGQGQGQHQGSTNPSGASYSDWKYTHSVSVPTPTTTPSSKSTDPQLLQANPQQLPMNLQEEGQQQQEHFNVNPSQEAMMSYRGTNPFPQQPQYHETNPFPHQHQYSPSTNPNPNPNPNSLQVQYPKLSPNSRQSQYQHKTSNPFPQQSLSLYQYPKPNSSQSQLIQQTSNEPTNLYSPAPNQSYQYQQTNPKPNSQYSIPSAQYQYQEASQYFQQPLYQQPINPVSNLQSQNQQTNSQSQYQQYSNLPPTHAPYQQIGHQLQYQSREQNLFVKQSHYNHTQENQSENKYLECVENRSEERFNRFDQQFENQQHLYRPSQLQPTKSLSSSCSQNLLSSKFNFGPDGVEIEESGNSDNVWGSVDDFNLSRFDDNYQGY